MEALRALGAAFPEAARDVKLNLQGVQQDSSLAEKLRWGVALASAYAARNPALREAVLEDGGAAAASRRPGSRRGAGSGRRRCSSPSAPPPRLRMNRIASPKTSKVEF